MTAERYPSGVPCWITTTPASMHFACELFDWTLEGDIARRGGRVVAGIGDRPGWTTYVRGGDIGERVLAAGGSVVGEHLYADPQGAVFGTSDSAEAELVNAPGGWNWSVLLTRDIDAAAAFYGAVFGWEVGAEGLVRRPGYVEVLERLDPGIRRRHAGLGTPEGFSDAVAWMYSGDGPPRWEVTFAVADTDATATRARELGGEIVEEPHDIPPVRHALLRDPEGTVFTVASFSP
jgi:predicted enzyme related to lactoylglutathione lyase